MKALLLDDTHPFLEEALIQGGLELIRDYTRPLLDFPVSYFECTVLVIRSRMPINAKFLSQFPHLKVIGRMGAGLENIDLSQAKLQGITCIRVPEGNSRAVAEHALAMLLSALKWFGRWQHEHINRPLPQTQSQAGRDRSQTKGGACFIQNPNGAGSSCPPATPN